MEIVEKKPSELIPYANNSRTHSDGKEGDQGGE